MVKTFAMKIAAAIILVGAPTTARSGGASAVQTGSGSSVRSLDYEYFKA
jgi:hypothetical protein